MLAWAVLVDLIYLFLFFRGSKWAQQWLPESGAYMVPWYVWIAPSEASLILTGFYQDEMANFRPIGDLASRQSVVVCSHLEGFVTVRTFFVLYIYYISTDDLCPLSALFQNKYADERSDDEDDGQPDDEKDNDD